MNATLIVAMLLLVAASLGVARAVRAGTPHRSTSIVLQIAVAANNRKSRTEGDIETCGTNNGIDFDKLSTCQFNAIGMDFGNSVGDHVDIWFCQRFEIARPRCETAATGRESRNNGFHQYRVMFQCSRHVYRESFCQGSCQAVIVH